MATMAEGAGEAPPVGDGPVGDDYVIDPKRDRLVLLKEMDLGVKPPSRAALQGPKPKPEQRMMGKRAQPRKYRRRR